MNEGADERYASAREHWRLVERVATVEADMRQIGPALARIETTLAASRSAPAGADHWQLTAQRAMDLLERRHANNGVGLGTMILIGFAMFGVGVSAFVIGKLFF